MKIAYAMPIILAVLLGLGLSLNNVSAELESNNAFLLEGSGFAVTEKLIKASQIDLVLSSGDQAGSRTALTIEDGFITLDDDDFIVIDLEGTGLRDGRFIRISGTAENDFGEELSIRVFGRLIQNSDGGSVYSFTGRIEQGNTSYKTIYTSKLSEFGVVSTPSSTTSTSDESGVVIHIKKGSSDPTGISYIDIGQPERRASPYTQDRIIIDPGTTITWINDDVVSHSISSGSGLGQNARASSGKVVICQDRAEELLEGFSFGYGNCTFTLDGRISSGEILPGESWSVTIEEQGFYRLADIDYIWMNQVIYAFPSSESRIIGTPSEEFN